MRRPAFPLVTIVAVAVLAGCGGGGGTTTSPSAATDPRTTPIPPATENPAFAGRAGKQRFDAVVQAACTTVTQNLPQEPAPGATPAELRAYDAAVEETATRLADALDRLATQRPASGRALRAVGRQAKAVRDAAGIAAGAPEGSTAVQDRLGSAIGGLREAAAGDLAGCTV